MERIRRNVFLVPAVLFVFTSCASYSHKSLERPNSPPPSTVQTPSFQQTGLASWYGPGFYGRKTASGDRFKKQSFTCAHRQLPFGTELSVTNLENGKTIQVTVNDRGPYVRNKIVDLSYAAARELGILKKGYARVELKTFEGKELADGESVATLPSAAAELPLENRASPANSNSVPRSAQSIENIIQELNK